MLEEGTLYLDAKANVLTVAQAFANVLAAQTDAALVAASGSLTLRVLSAVVLPGGTATSVTFNSKPAGAGVAISATFAVAANTPLVLPHNKDGWFQTTAGQGLTVTTGAGATVGIQINYVACP